AGGPCDHFLVSAQQDAGRSHVDVLADREDDLTKTRGLLACAPREHLVHRPRRRGGGGEEAEGGMALWVHIHQQHPALRAREESRKVDGCDGLSASTLLVHNGDRPLSPAPSS